MLNKYLKKLSEIKIELIETKLVNWKILNLVLFWDKIPEDLEKYKIIFLRNMLDKTNRLLEIIEELNNDINKVALVPYIENEIFVKIKKIEFLKKVYDIEANKLDSNYKIKEELEDYDTYNQIFYWFTKNNLEQEIIISENKGTDIFVSKEKVTELLEFSKKMIPELKWNFWNFTWLSHNFGILNIPEEKEYNIKRIIAIFFHEMTHFFRYINWKKNLWFDYIFADYDDLEEGIIKFR